MNRGACRAVALTASATVVVVVVGLAIAWRPRRVVVEGASMEPALFEGDRLLVVRSRRVGPGDIVAVRDPRHPARLLVKRVTSVVGDEVTVHGDNASASTDSRVFGPLPRGALLGRVIRRYQRGQGRPPG